MRERQHIYISRHNQLLRRPREVGEHAMELLELSIEWLKKVTVWSWR